MGPALVVQGKVEDAHDGKTVSHIQHLCSSDRELESGQIGSIIRIYHLINVAIGNPL